MTDWVILGCGYVGTRLARRLLAEGRTVRAFSRHPEKLAALAALGARVQALDATKSRQFGPALYGSRSPVVVYSIPSQGGMPGGVPVRRAGEAAMGVGASRFIYLSSTAVYGPTFEGEVVDEDSSLALTDGDAILRIADEGAVQGIQLSGLATVVLRLAAVYGPGRGVRERLKAGTYKLIDEGEHMFSRVHVDDVVGVILAAAERAPNPAVYCVADDRPTTQKEYADWLVGRLGSAPPLSVASLAPGKPRRPVRNRAVSNQRLKSELGYVLRYPTFLEGEPAIEAELGESAGVTSAAVTPAPVTSAPATSAPIAAPPAPVAAPPAPVAAPPVAPGEAANLNAPDLSETLRRVEELWLEAMLRELAATVTHAGADRLAEARAAMERAAALGELLEHQLRVLARSAYRSPDLAPIDACAQQVWTAFESALSLNGVELVRLSSNAALSGLARALYGFDAAMQRFKREQLSALCKVPLDTHYFGALRAVREGM